MRLLWKRLGLFDRQKPASRYEGHRAGASSLR
jgi:hypothetical protein